MFTKLIILLVVTIICPPTRVLMLFRLCSTQGFDDGRSMEGEQNQTRDPGIGDSGSGQACSLHFLSVPTSSIPLDSGLGTIRGYILCLFESMLLQSSQPPPCAQVLTTSWK